MLAAAFYLCTVAWIADGDTLTCADGTRVRLQGIEAAEIACRANRRRFRPCGTPAAFEAQRALIALAPRGTVLRCQGRRKSYDRLVSWCTTEAGADLSCAMVAGGHAARVDSYWRRHSCGGSDGRSSRSAR